MTQTPPIRKGPRLHRMGIVFFSGLLAVLLIWLGRFGLHDIEGLPVPQISNTQLFEQMTGLRETIKEIDRKLKVEQERQGYLQESTESSRQTLDQLLDMHRASLDKELAISPEESKAFAASQEIFLRNQEQVQAVMESTLALKAERRVAEEALRDAQAEVSAAQRPLRERHRHIVALLKFAALAPFVALGAWLFARKRGSSFAPLMHAFNAAVLFLLLTVIHEHFPKEYYKYMFLAMAIATVAGLLAFLIRQFTRPSASWLLQRCKEAYHASQCPVCQYPIVAHDMRSLVPPRPGWRLRMQTVPERDKAAAHVCPSCGTRLFDTCGNCQELRHTLLPHCLHCGAETEASM